MYCRKCGTELQEGAKFCVKCGHSVSEVQSSEIPASEVPSSEVPFAGEQNPEPELKGAVPSGPDIPCSNVKGPRPDNYVWLAVLVTLLCCIPLGIVSIVYAVKVDSYWLTGDYAAAKKYSTLARNWALAGIGFSLLFWIAYLVVVILYLGSDFDCLLDEIIYTSGMYSASMLF